MGARKGQSAMEYLMTYGWAILVIAVALGALYSLGVFGANSSTAAPSCLAQAGYLCSNPVINTNGILAVKFGQISASTMTLTGIGCTSNSTPPVITQSINAQLASGQTMVLAFLCPIAANKIGSNFKGILWLIYNTPTTNGVIDRLGEVTVQATITGNVIAAEGGGNSAGGTTSTTSTSTTSTASTTVVYSLDVHASSSTSNTFSLATSGSNEIILVGADGCCSAVLPTGVFVDANAATAIGSTDNGQAIATSWGYVAPGAASHNIAVSEGGITIKKNFGASFVGQNPLGYANVISSGNTLSITTTVANSLVFVSAILDTGSGSAGALTWSGTVTPTMLDTLSQAGNLDSGDSYFIAGTVGTYFVSVADSQGLQFPQDSSIAAAVVSP